MHKKNVSVLFISAILLISFTSGCSRTEKISRPFEYSGYSKPRWEGSKHISEYVTMRDGTKIAVDVFLPKTYTGKGHAPEKFPGVFQYTPYHRTLMDMETGNIITPYPHHALFLSHGYAVAIADMRGTGASFGWMIVMDPIVCDDGKEIIVWMAAQPWCDGKVGMEGGSYVGWSQIACASRKPEALKCIAPMVAGLDGFMMKPGGIYSYAFMQFWSAFTNLLNRNMMVKDFRSIPPTPPVIDEDGDGNLVDEIPMDANGNGAFFDDYAWPVNPDNPPQYSDGLSRENHFYFNATMEHVAHPDGAPGDYDPDIIWSDRGFRDDKRPGDGLTVADINLALIPSVMQSEIPVYNIGGWFDPFIRNTFELYGTMKRTNPSKIVARPCYHQGISPAFAELIGFDAALGDPRELMMALGREELRWFDCWLKGIDNGIDKEPPVVIYVMNGEGYRFENEWPLARQVLTKFYITGDNALAKAQPPTDGKDEYTADFTHNSGWGPEADTAWIAAVNDMVGKPHPTAQLFPRNRQQMMGVAETPPYRTEKDLQCLTYTTPPLEADVEVTGHPIVHVWVSSSADYGDVFFYLVDVDANGESVLVTERGHRAEFTTLQDNDRMIPDNPGIDVLPDLPWHGYDRADYEDKVFAGGKIVKIVTDLYPTSWVFKKGHRMRVSIACADWPTFKLHPKLSPSNSPDAPDNIVPTVTIYRNKDYVSYIELPIIPKE
ncbi:MAG: CocE/NonD family hydrolase [Candidatus Aminicenantes bacterium]|nr:CocE/NonD family hydrolase [Candidatus Aminicenantes bacterium]